MAAYLDRKNGLQKPEAAQVIAAECSPLMLDSGRLSWMKKGMTDWARQDLTPLLLSVGHRIGASVIVAGDVPMEPQMLAKVSMSPREALDITWRAN